MTTFHDRSTGSDIELGGPFNPGEGNYSGTSYQYQRFSPATGDTKRNSAKMASMMGQHAAKDAELNIPTGSTTNFKSGGNGKLQGFLPNAHDKQMGSWN